MALIDLSATDAQFLHLESRDTPMHIASVQILELAAEQTPEQFVDELRKRVFARRAAVPYLTRTLNPLTFRWDETGTFDPTRHIRLARVAAPGDRAALCASIAKLHEVPLRRDVPLWDIVVLAGLEEGRVALYNRVHHASVDGAAGQLAIEAITDAQPISDTDLSGRATAQPQSSQPTQWPDFAKQWTAALEALQHMAHPAAGLTHFNMPAPATRLNRSVGNKRTYATGELKLADVKRVAKAHQASLNEVFLAVCGGGLRRYLERLGELPGATLQASVPIALRSASDTTFNNQVSATRVAVGSHIADPQARLSFVREASHFAKQMSATLQPFNTPTNAATSAPLQQWMASQFHNAAAAGLTPAPGVNLVISNVRGPVEPRYFAGARMTSHHPVSIPAHGMGVNITVQSYSDHLYMGITACAKALPDAHLLAGDIMAEWQLLAPPEVVLDPVPEPGEPEMSQVA